MITGFPYIQTAGASYKPPAASTTVTTTHLRIRADAILPTFFADSIAPSYMADSLAALYFAESLEGD